MAARSLQHHEGADLARVANPDRSEVSYFKTPHTSNL
jgi:hypothetical protein